MKNQFIFVLVIASVLNAVKSYLIGVDIGSEFFKIISARPGRQFSIVENLQSKMKTPTAISIKGEEIMFGADALTKKARYPKNILTFFSDYLGENYNSTYINDFIKNFFISYDIEENPERNTITFKFVFNKENESLSIEEIYALLFNYVKFLSEKFIGVQITDCFITVPNFFNYKQRHAIAQAVQLSHLNLAGIVSEPLAAAVQYQLKKSFPKEEFFIFYDMGGSFTQVALVSFKTAYFEEKNKDPVEIGNNIKVIAQSWNRRVGGRDFTRKVALILMKKFDALPQRKDKPSVMENKGVYERVYPHAVKYKEVLSANKNAHVAILGVEDGMNLEGSISREEFEESSKDLLDQVYQPIEDVLKKANLTFENITFIELIGGSIRVPKIKEVIQEKLGNYSSILGIHMNGDDSMAFGTAYIAANATKKIRERRKTWMVNGANAEYKIYVKNLNDSLPFCEKDKEEVLSKDCVKELDINRVLIDEKAGYGTKRKVRKELDTDLSIRVTEKMSNEEEEKDIMEFEVTGIREVVEEMLEKNYTQKPNVTLKFYYNEAGIISLSGFTSYKEYLYLCNFTGPNNTEEFKYSKEYCDHLPKEEIDEINHILNTSVVEGTTVKKNDTSKDANKTEGEDKAKSENEEQKENKTITREERNILIKKKKIGEIRVNPIEKRLKISINYTSPKPLSPEQMKKARKTLQKFEEIELNRTRLIEIKNALEARLYQYKNELDDKGFKRFANDSEIEKTKDFVKNSSDWFEEDGYLADYETIGGVLSDLEKHFKVYFRRMSGHVKRVEALEKFTMKYSHIANETVKLLKEREWLREYHDEVFQKNMSDIISWLNETMLKQEALAVHEKPVLTAEMIINKINDMEHLFYKLKTFKKPDISKDLDESIKSMFNETNFGDFLKNHNISEEDYIKMQEAIKNDNSTESKSEEGKEKKEEKQEKVEEEEEKKEKEEKKVEQEKEKEKEEKKEEKEKEEKEEKEKEKEEKKEEKKEKEEKIEQKEEKIKEEERKIEQEEEKIKEEKKEVEQEEEKLEEKEEKIEQKEEKIEQEEEKLEEKEEKIEQKEEKIEQKEEKIEQKEEKVEHEEEKIEEEKKKIEEERKKIEEEKKKIEEEKKKIEEEKKKIEKERKKIEEEKKEKIEEEEKKEEENKEEKEEEEKKEKKKDKGKKEEKKEENKEENKEEKEEEKEKNQKEKEDQEEEKVEQENKKEEEKEKEKQQEEKNKEENKGKEEKEEVEQKEKNKEEKEEKKEKKQQEEEDQEKEKEKKQEEEKKEEKKEENKEEKEEKKEEEKEEKNKEENKEEKQQEEKKEEYKEEKQQEENKEEEKEEKKEEYKEEKKEEYKEEYIEEKQQEEEKEENKEENKEEKKEEKEEKKEEKKEEEKEEKNKEENKEEKEKENKEEKEKEEKNKEEKEDL